MQPVIKTLKLQHFRSILAEEIEFDNPTFLVGMNGAGKSNVVDAIRFLAEIASDPLDAVLERRNGSESVRTHVPGISLPTPMGLGVRMVGLGGDGEEGHYAFAIESRPRGEYRVAREQAVVMFPSGERCWFDRTPDAFRSNVPELTPTDVEDASLALPIVGGQARFAPLRRALLRMRAYSIDPVRLIGAQDVNGSPMLGPDGSNAARVLRDLEEQSAEAAERISQILTTIVPYDLSVSTRQEGRKRVLQFEQQWGQGKRLPFDPISMSDGTLRVLGLLLATHQTRPPTVLAIEEPEATIHPGAIDAVLDVIRHAARRGQVIVTTHHPELLDAKWIEDRHLRVVEWRGHEGATRVAPISKASRESLREHLMGAGEMLRCDALDAEVLTSVGARLPVALFEELE